MVKTGKGVVMSPSSLEVFKHSLEAACQAYCRDKNSIRTKRLWSQKNLGLNLGLNPCHLPVLWPWVAHEPFFSLCLLVCKME